MAVVCSDIDLLFTSSQVLLNGSIPLVQWNPCNMGLAKCPLTVEFYPMGQCLGPTVTHYQIPCFWLVNVCIVRPHHLFLGDFFL